MDLNIFSRQFTSVCSHISLLNHNIQRCQLSARPSNLVQDKPWGQTEPESAPDAG